MIWHHCNRHFRDSTSQPCVKPAAGRKSDDKHVWLASEGQAAGGMATNIVICNHVVACSQRLQLWGYTSPKKLGRAWFLKSFYNPNLTICMNCSLGIVLNILPPHVNTSAFLRRLSGLKIIRSWTGSHRTSLSQSKFCYRSAGVRTQNMVGLRLLGGWSNVHLNILKNVLASTDLSHCATASPWSMVDHVKSWENL